MNRQGYSLVEALVAMILFAIGILSLSQSYFGIVRAQLTARNHELALNCARDRMEEVVNCLSYSSINSAQFPSEEYGQVDGGAAQYEIFNRNVTIDDSLNAGGTSVLKEITVEVNWQAMGGTRTASLNSVIAAHSDITP